MIRVMQKRLVVLKNLTVFVVYKSEMNMVELLGHL